jgi:pimeloyl-ACP methyl ester carboxylesterase
VVGVALVGSAARLRVGRELMHLLADPSKIEMAVDWITENSCSPNTSLRLKELARRRTLEGRSSVLYGDFQACNAFEPPFDQMKRITAPALLLFGEDDRMAPPAMGRLLQKYLPQARLETLGNAGHMVMLEQPERVTELLGEFIQSLPYLPGQ